MVEELITFILKNFTLTFFIIGLLCSAFSLFCHARPLNRTIVVEALFSFYLLFSIGISFLYNFVVHVFLAEISAKFIGWENSPFQYEVGYASLGFGVVGLLAFRNNFGLRLAAVVGPALFLWGAAAGHVYHILHDHNFSPGNAGIILWTDLLLPVFGFVLIYLQYKDGRQLKDS